MSKTILIATQKPFSPDAKQQASAFLEEAGYQVRVLEAYDDEAALKGALAEADAVIVRSDKIHAGVLDAAKQLKLVVRAGAGYDSIDCAGAKERGVTVMNTPGQNANAVAELVFGLLVYTARGHYDGKPGTELKGKTLGIHALGNVGKNVLRIAHGFGMEVIAHDPFVEAQDIQALDATPIDTVEELYAKSDYLSLHIPATPKTIGSIGKALLSAMPKGATLINTARAEVIDEPGLLEALREREDLHYVTDIAPSDETDAALKELGKRYFRTPKKMGAQTAEANTNAATAAAHQIVAFFE
ncbi:MAG TPA: NAD(P)-dependent oxidoreductase, partial [Polyangiaceae bacterium LLY-WYZ-15_(1-7)]|nr:NAD(P)-dependent oxidoreductase [Polyangiaceae bacterium LLY-WYZ-15_(1-7)]